MNLEALQQIGMLHCLPGNAGDFEAQMQYWDELAGGPLVRFVRWLGRSLRALLAQRIALSTRPEAQGLRAAP